MVENASKGHPSGKRRVEKSIGPVAQDIDAHRKRVNKGDVVREATRLFAEKGYDGLTMGELATRVGLRKASLFHHFPTKDALYERVLTTLVEAMETAVFGALGTEGTALDRLDSLSDAITAALGSHPHAARLLVGEAVHGGALMREILGGKVDAVLSTAREFIRSGQREGVFDRELDPTHVVLTIAGAHFIPFAVEDIVHRFTGAFPAHPAFVGARTVAMREQVRRMLGVRK
ncbi:MAG TPA: TetR family transcriptional regulator [Labilithrix sp.]|nr:TetR family transcriptional regulator [Labilithrix sp.]